MALTYLVLYSHVGNHNAVLMSRRHGLQLISMMYAAFQQFAPDTDIGIDLSKEYGIATQSG